MVFIYVAVIVLVSGLFYLSMSRWIGIGNKVVKHTDESLHGEDEVKDE
jgi:hypothetical protein